MDALNGFPYRVVGSLILLGAALLPLSVGQPQHRLRGNIESNQTFTLTGNTRPSLARARDQGEAGPALPLTGITLHFTLSAAQLADQQQLQKQQLTRRTSQYHKWLTPEQYGDRFGLNSADLELISTWLAREGFSDIEVARSRTAISFSGNAAQVQAAFRTPIHRYLVNGESHYASASDPILPNALQGMVAGIGGLDDMRPKPRARPHLTSSSNGNHYLVPDDFATIYDIQPLYGAGIDGSGSSIAIVGQSDIDLSDIEAFRAYIGLPQNDPRIILTGPDPGTDSASEGEADLDIEWAGGIARNAAIVYVNSNHAFHSLYYAIENAVAPVISVSYYECEADLGSANSNALNSLLQQATMEGLTVVAGSGDWGAAGCDQTFPATAGFGVGLPASSPYVTGVGGATFNEGSGVYWNSTNNAYNGSALSYIPEVAWNDISISTNWGASGGGASAIFSKPIWQTGAGVPNDGMRDVPDLALASSPYHDGFLVCSAGSCATDQFYVDGGTSVAAPAFAAIAALLNQWTQHPLGNINPTLYLLASYSLDAFHDITSGNNIVPCAAGSPDCPAETGLIGFSAAPGYDQVTGLGSVDAFNLIREWNGDFQISANPGTLSIGRGASANVMVAVIPQGNFAGNVGFTCSVASSLTNTTCSIPDPVPGSHQTTLTITTGSTAAAPRWRVGGLWALIGLGGVLPLLFMRRRRPLWAGAFLLIMAALWMSCGDGGGTTSANFRPVLQETGAVTINATGGQFLTNSATVSVSVQ